MSVWKIKPSPRSSTGYVIDHPSVPAREGRQLKLFVYYNIRLYAGIASQVQGEHQRSAAFSRFRCAILETKRW